jgi:hypothetical protein
MSLPAFGVESISLVLYADPRHVYRHAPGGFFRLLPRAFFGPSRRKEVILQSIDMTLPLQIDLILACGAALNATGRGRPADHGTGVSVLGNADRGFS